MTYQHSPNRMLTIDFTHQYILSSFFLSYRTYIYFHFSFNLVVIYHSHATWSASSLSSSPSVSASSSSLLWSELYPYELSDGLRASATALPRWQKHIHNIFDGILTQIIDNIIEHTNACNRCYARGQLNILFQLLLTNIFVVNHLKQVAIELQSDTMHSTRLVWFWIARQ